MEEKLENIEFTPSNDFIETPYLKRIIERCIGYLKAGIPIELRGAAGVGKTSMAVHIAKTFNRPIILLYGNDEFSSGALMGNYLGFRKKYILDNYITSVEKKEESYQMQWIDGRLVTACRNGYTLIYDEFTRTRPETNNMLLSVLSEGIVEIPNVKKSEKYIKVHPDFKIIFTSNQEEYAGVYKEQDALKDRILTIEIDGMDLGTHAAIIRSKTGLNMSDSEKLAKFMDNIAQHFTVLNIISVRKSIMLAKAVKSMNIPVDPKNTAFINVCKDIIISSCLNSARNGIDRREIQKEIDRFFDYGNKGVK